MTSFIHFSVVLEESDFLVVGGETLLVLFQDFELVIIFNKFRICLELATTVRLRNVAE